MSSRFAAARILGAVGGLGYWNRQSVHCEADRGATCIRSEQHTHNTRKIQFKVDDGSSWTPRKIPIANVVVKVNVDGVKEAGCCACCSCPQPCACPKGPNGCCACCKCPGTCGCPKKSVPVEKGCCGCCSCPPPCACPKGPNGCCACCKCPGECGCPKKEAAGSSQVARPYNPLNAESGDEFTLLVKKYDAGKMGTKLHSLQAGDKIEFKGPNQQWDGWEEGKFRHYYFVAGGTGITPLMQACEFIVANDNPYTEITFITFNKSQEDILLHKELEALKDKAGPRFEVKHCIESGSARSVSMHGYNLASKEEMAKVLKQLLGDCCASKFVMICGRKEMTEHVAGPKTPDFKQGELGGILKDMNWKKENVWKV